jgi:hypothetical protein
VCIGVVGGLCGQVACGDEPGAAGAEGCPLKGQRLPGSNQPVAVALARASSAAEAFRRLSRGPAISRGGGDGVWACSSQLAAAAACGRAAAPAAHQGC